LYFSIARDIYEEDIAYCGEISFLVTKMPSMLLNLGYQSVAE